MREPFAMYHLPIERPLICWYLEFQLIEQHPQCPPPILRIFSC